MYKVDLIGLSLNLCFVTTIRTRTHTATRGECADNKIKFANDFILLSNGYRKKKKKKQMKKRNSRVGEA